MTSSSDAKLNPYMTVSVSRDDFFKSTSFTLRDGTVLYGSIATSEKLNKGSFVLLHGLSSNRKMWQECGMQLVSMGFSILTLDMKYHGESFRSSTPGPDLTLRTFTEDVFEVLGILSRMDSIWVQPIVCGQSWGGSVVLELAKLHPESIRGIVCVDGGFIDLQKYFPEWCECERKLRPPSLKIEPHEFVPTIQSWIPTWSHLGCEGMMSNFFADPSDGGLYKLRLAMNLHMGILHSLWECRPVERYADLKAPVLLISAGSRDFFSENKDVDVSALCDVLPMAFVDKFPANGHDIHTENPVGLAEVLRRYVIETLAGGTFSVAESAAKQEECRDW